MADKPKSKAQAFNPGAVTATGIPMEAVIGSKYDDTELREMIQKLSYMCDELYVREDKDTIYDDQELRTSLSILSERLSYLENHEDKDTIYNDSELRGMISYLSDAVNKLNKKEDKDTVYDDTEIRQMISNITMQMSSSQTSTSPLSNVVDLTSVFSTGDANKINAALKTNATKVVYVGPGNYNLNGTICLAGVMNFYCFGNLIGPNDVSKLKPMSEYWATQGSTLYKNDVIRTLICHNGTGVRCYINKITVKHNYCAFYVYYGKAMNIQIDTITGSYASTTKSEYKSVFNNGAKFTSKTTRYSPIPDEWYMNSGFMTDHIADSTINIGGIDNLNYGINFIETIPDKVSAPWSGINFGYIEIMCNTFNINSIVCKKAITFDFEHAIEWNNGATVHVTTHNRTGNNIHGNVFNICGFDYTKANNTNIIETINPDWYDQSKDNRRIMFNMIGKSNDTYQEVLANNVFNASYYQGIYDVVVNAKNVSCLIWNGYLQPNDVYFNDGTSHSQRNRINSTYTRGTKDGYETAVKITVGPILIFDNCYNCEFNNIARAFIRDNEIQVTNSNNIKINQVAMSPSSDFYHRIMRSNIADIKTVIYDGTDKYVKDWLSGYSNQ